MADRGPIALITGTSKGIGRSLAEAYLEAGMRVYGCSRKESDLISPAYRHFCLDVADETGVKKMFDAIRAECGRLDILINNAGIASMNHFLLTPTGTVRRVFDTNVVGTFLMCREAVKLMKSHGCGRIVNFSTVAVPLALEGEAAYAASKAAIESLTEVLAREVASFGITVNAVGPTPVATDLIAAIPEAKLTQLLNRQAIKRKGTFADVKNVVDFFLRQESEFITGQVLYLGGVV